jgi:hypothetical protein
MARTHQPGQGAFKSILPEDIDWKQFPAFPSSVRLAVVVGEPSEAAPYTIRVKVPCGVKLMPHKHPEDRVYTVISGVFYIGLGDQFDGDKVEAYPPGSVIVLPVIHVSQRHECEDEPDASVGMPGPPQILAQWILHVSWIADQ